MEIGEPAFMNPRKPNHRQKGYAFHYAQHPALIPVMRKQNKQKNNA
jgi:hypothetical protein